MKARIYQPPKTATQSGTARTKDWRLEFDPAAARYVEPLMGWTGSRDTMGQISMSFPDKDSAVAFAVKHRLAYEVEEPPPKRPQRKSYADNFAFRRQT
jgi:ETC complex I subunit conserved region